MNADDSPEDAPATKRALDSYWLLEGVSLLVLNALGGLYVQGEDNIPASGQVLCVANHVSYLDPVGIGDACTRRVVFMAKSQLFKVPVLGSLLRGVDAFPVRRGEADRVAFRNTLDMLAEGRVVCIFPEGKRSPDGALQPAEAGAAVFAMKTSCPVVPVYVSGTNEMLDRRGKLHRGRVTVAFGKPFTIARKTDRDDAARQLMAAIADTRDVNDGQPSRRIYPHWTTKPREGSRAR